MRKFRIPSRRGLALAAGGAVTSAAMALGLVSPASAATPGQIVVCAQGNYAGFVLFGFARTNVAQPGHCSTTYFPGVADEQLQVEVFGEWVKPPHGPFPIWDVAVNIHWGVTFYLRGNTGNGGANAYAAYGQNVPA
jgi:hypothetical protein